jgi:hypothetical protein
MLHLWFFYPGKVERDALMEQLQRTILEMVMEAVRKNGTFILKVVVGVMILSIATTDHKNNLVVRILTNNV